MEASLTHLASQFGGHTHSRVLEMARREHWFIKAREDKKRKEAEADRSEADMGDLGAAAVLATPTQIEQFEVRLDELDAATIEALEKNRICMEDVQRLLLEVDQDIQWMLDQTHMMEDGRRVFLTRDRTQAFDEFGAEVFETELDFDLISQTAPAYEDYAEKVELRGTLQEEFDSLTAERQTLLDFQDRLDEAREQISDGPITANGLEALDAELDELMPSSVARHLPENELSGLDLPKPEQLTTRAKLTVPNPPNALLQEFKP